MLKDEIGSMNHQLRIITKAWEAVKQDAQYTLDSNQNEAGNQDKIPAGYYKTRIDVGFAVLIDLGEKIEARFKADKECQ